MKKLLKALLASALLLTLSACSSKPNENTIKVSATLDPHSKILEFAKPLLKEKGYDLEIIVLDNYYIFNQALNNGEVDANYFQHVPFFESDVAENNYDLVNVAGIHIEPFGFYSNNITSLDQLLDGAVVVISNSVADHGRVLAILEFAGLIELDPSVDKLNATTTDIISNPKNITFKQINPELLTTALNNNEGDLVGINGNYAIANGLNPANDAIILEDVSESNPYVNILAVKNGTQDSAKIQTLIEVMTSQDVANFILETYNDSSVLPVKR